MIRIALVEDEESSREEYVGYLRRYEAESGQRFTISVFTDGDEIVENYTASYDIILMDIAMRFMDGMTAAEEIRKKDTRVVILFITNSTQYAIRGYTVDALDYVLKPVTYFSFTQRLERALRRMEKREKRWLTLPTRGGLTRLDAAALTYVEVRDHDLVYHTRETAYTLRGTLADAEKSLDPARFFRVSKCCLVNLEYVESLSGMELTVAGESIQVSRSRKKATLDALNRFLSEVSK